MPKLNKQEIAREARKQRRLEALGTDDPHCAMCPESDPFCLEGHHIAGRKYNETEIIVCRNCHRKLSDDQKDHHAFDSNADPMLQRIGHFLLGLADMLRRIVDRLAEYGAILIETASKNDAGEVVA